VGGALGLATGIALITLIQANEINALRERLGLPVGSELIKTDTTLGGYVLTWRLPDGSTRKITVNGNPTRTDIDTSLGLKWFFGLLGY
jgi:hypothetical protein